MLFKFGKWGMSAHSALSIPPFMTFGFVSPMEIFVNCLIHRREATGTLMPQITLCRQSRDWNLARRPFSYEFVEVGLS